ncbi:FtsK/SpoIIIE domain-containing protein [Kineosporia succinea]|uniref:S-DNA-T family DNA segregation ATPase FtsK/SpoIIIE n=1 Tax=Kineosporia succinea TaxID=84632 RepID=A0ABT9P1H5_9ACTN|nr:FtsK/SpoIIIE domain-containing protein [Kineosporia succinea]MDP9826537.1 S-DNA-T family DNA segregation ATPase FtsK/SpoIIIE [Kineosporia succinea]
MLVNGTRVEDLAGTGLTTKQRYVVPLWVTIPLFLGRHLLKGTSALVKWAITYWGLSLPTLVLLIIWQRFNGLVALTALTWWLLLGLVWAYRWPASFDVAVTQPCRGVWRWWTKYRRLWHPAMDGTGLTRMTPDRQVYVPAVTRVRSTRVVDALHLRLLHGQTPADVAARAEGLRHVYGAHRCSVIEDGPGRVRVLFYSKDPLRRLVVPLDPAPLPALDALPVALGEDGEVFRLCLRGRHVLIVGASGAGKGSAVWSTLKALAPAVAAGTVRLRGVDPKGGMELFPGRALFAEYADEDLADLVALLEQAVADMNDRKRRLKAAGVRVFTPSTTDPLEVILIDELAFLTAYAPKDIKLKVAAALQVLLSQGRAVGYSVVAALQDPRKDVLPFRDLFTYRIALRLSEDSHVDMVLGDGALERGAACHLIPASLPGIAYVHVEGAHEPVRIRFSYLSDDDIVDMASHWPSPENTDWTPLPDTDTEPPLRIELRDVINQHKDDGDDA